MEITEVKVFPVSEDKLKAFVSIVLDCCFMVNDIKVIRGKDGLFISMPSRKKKSGEFKDVAHPLNNETRRRIEERVLDEYERVLRGRGEAPEVGRRRLKIDDEEDGARPGAAMPAGALAAPPPERSPEVPPLAAAPSEADGGGPAARPSASAAPGTPGSAQGPQAPPDAPAAAARSGAGREGESSPEGKSLEEIQEMHLRDSFWSVS